MILEYLKDFFKRSPDIIQKSEVEKIFNLAMVNYNETVIPTFYKLLNVNEEAIDKTVITVINKHLIGKKPKDIISSYITVLEKISKNEVNLRKLLATLPENIMTNTITAKTAGTLALISNINTFALLSLDVAIVLITPVGSSDFTAGYIKGTRLSMMTINSLIENLSDIEGQIKGLEKTDNEVNINEDNIAIESILKSKGKLNISIVRNNFINLTKIAYTIGTWLVDNELKKYEALKLKRLYLLQRLMELENESNKNPDDLVIKKAKKIYADEIAKITYQIEKIENS